jgi:uncharacterized SAM-binding protein YcdF (DUF218 family)
VGLGLLTLLAVREANLVLSTPITSWTQDPSADCGVVLTGGAGRVREGLSLLEKSSIRTLVISGVNPSTELHDLLTPMDRAIGVKPEQVILERRSMTTYGNAHQSAPILEALRCRDVVLITSRLHMFRAKKTFEAALPGSIRIVPHAVASPKGEEDLWVVGTEVLKSLFYSLWAYP